MRNLTIKRNKTFVASLTKMKVYIEDPAVNELTIHNTPCRKLGTLKNGEEKTFVIGDGAAKVFVIADKLTKEYCNDCYQLPEGQEDIFLTGQNKFKPTRENAFCFDNNNSPAMVENRKKGAKIGTIVLIVAAIVGLLIGYPLGRKFISAKKAEPKTFEVSGMQITLTNEFAETEVEPYLAAYDSKKVAVFVVRESIDDFLGADTLSLADYAMLVIQANGLEEDSLRWEGDMPYLTYDYTNPTSGTTYRYFCYMYRSEEAFWVIQFATPAETVEEFIPKIIQWAKSVEFSK